MTKLTPTERASKGGQASTHRPFRDKPGAASAAAKAGWSKMTPEQRSERARKASQVAAINRVPEEKRAELRVKYGIAETEDLRWFSRPEFCDTAAARIARKGR